jgi:sugar/nucleoside kinase (ribokinase family)
MSVDLIISGYPGLDHIMPVNRAPQPGETGVILRAPRLDTATPGGCAPNIAVACARLGIKTAVVIVIGNDQDGKRLVEALEREGVNTQYGIHVIPGGHTAHTFLFLDPENRHQTFYFPGVSGSKDLSIHLEEGALGSAKWGVITVGSHIHNLEVLDLMVASNIPILWSHKNDKTAFPKELVERLTQVSAIVVLNKHEADAVQKTLELTGISDLLQRGPNAVILTRGEDGCRIITTEGTRDVPAVAPDHLVDPTGAGDGFCGCQTSLPNLPSLQARYWGVFGEEIQFSGASLS